MKPICRFTRLPQGRNRIRSIQIYRLTAGIMDLNLCNSKASSDCTRNANDPPKAQSINHLPVKFGRFALLSVIKQSMQGREGELWGEQPEVTQREEENSINNALKLTLLSPTSEWGVNINFVHSIRYNSSRYRWWQPQHGSLLPPTK